MATLKGRERFLYSSQPGWEMMTAGYFVVVGLALLVIGLLKMPAISAFALAPFAFAAAFFYRAKWTRDHPDVQERVQRKRDERLTAHPVKYMVVSVVLLGGAGAYELWRLTTGPRHHNGAPPLWAWPAVVIAGMVVGYVSWRIRLARARQRQSGKRPYPVETRFRDASDNQRSTTVTGS